MDHGALLKRVEKRRQRPSNGCAQYGNGGLGVRDSLRVRRHAV